MKRTLKSGGMSNRYSTRAIDDRIYWEKIENLFVSLPVLIDNHYICTPFLKRLDTSKDMNPEILNIISGENKAIRAGFPKFGPGDTVNVHYKIREGAKERIQQFQGTVIQIKNSGSNGETFTVRKVSGGIAVERIFPFLTPNLDKVELLRKGKVRRARLFYLRDRKGKSARIKEKI